MLNDPRHSLCSVPLIRRHLRSSCQDFHSAFPLFCPGVPLAQARASVEPSDSRPPGWEREIKSSGLAPGWPARGQGSQNCSRPHISEHPHAWLASRGQSSHPSSGDSRLLHTARGGLRSLANSASCPDPSREACGRQQFPRTPTPAPSLRAQSEACTVKFCSLKLLPCKNPPTPTPCSPHATVTSPVASTLSPATHTSPPAPSF